MLFFCLPGQKVLLVALDQLEAIGHATFRYSAPFLPFFFFSSLPVAFFFPQDRHHIVQRQYIIMSFSSITGECGSSAAPLQKLIEFMSLTLYGSNNK